MTYASPGRVPHAAAPLTRRHILLAGALDQLLLCSVFVTCLLVGLFGPGNRSTTTMVASAVVAVVAVVACITIQTRSAVRTGSTAGMFVFGIRFDPAEPVDWHDDAVDWLLSFWENLVLVPAYWLTSRLSRGRAEAQKGLVRDPRARTGGARLARVVLAAAIVAPVVVPCVLAFS